MPWRAFSLDAGPAALDAMLADVAVVVHCAGPFVDTWRPMVAACVRTGTHYLDINGEPHVIEAIAAEHGPAAAAVGVMLLPAAGFDVVPSDVLARAVAQAAPQPLDLSASELSLYFHFNAGECASDESQPFPI